MLFSYVKFKILQQLVEYQISIKQNLTLTVLLFLQVSGRGIFLHSCELDSFPMQVQNLLLLCSDFLLLHIQRQETKLEGFILCAIHKFHTYLPCKYFLKSMIHLQCSTSYQSFHIFFVYFQSLIVLIHSIHMASNFKIINSNLHTKKTFIYYIYSLILSKYLKSTLPLDSSLTNMYKIYISVN